MYKPEDAFVWFQNHKEDKTEMMYLSRDVVRKLFKLLGPKTLQSYPAEGDSIELINELTNNSDCEFLVVTRLICFLKVPYLLRSVVLCVACLVGPVSTLWLFLKLTFVSTILVIFVCCHHISSTRSWFAILDLLVGLIIKSGNPFLRSSEIVHPTEVAKNQSPCPRQL